jgi:hypothetical protein
MAVNPAGVDQQAITASRFGLRTDKATAALPASTTGTLFTITGGRVAILGIIGEVTTALQAQACTLKLVSTPTTGTAVDICATLDVNGKEIGALFGITGTFATALVGANAGAGVMCTQPVVAPIGTIKASTGATNTGSVKWTCYWLPLDDGAVLA